MLNNHEQSPEVIVVEASAGSGKTFALAKRYLRLLIRPPSVSQIPIRNILAITFTNKATIEMKERILDLLKRISLGTFTNKEQEEDIFATLGVSKEFAKEQASRIMDELIHNYTYFQIQTIDSFINALLAGCAMDIERSAHFRIKRDYASYLVYCLDSVIEEASGSKEVLKFFEDFLEHYLFVESRASWFPKKDILQRLHSLFTLSNKYGKDFKTYDIETKEILRQRAVVFEAIKKLAASLPEGVNLTAKKTIERFINNNDRYFDLKKVPAAFQSQDIPLNKNKDVAKDIKEQWKRIHIDLRSLIEFDAFMAYNPYIMLFEKMLASLKNQAKQEDILFLEELNRKAHMLFAGGIAVSEVYYRLATRFTHYLIDEFQDTSVLQWKNLEPLVTDTLASGGSLFYVGDKKQAIYRFRGGEAELFDRVKADFSHYNAALQVLAKNWRSQKAIVDFNNEIFSQNNLVKALAKMNIAEYIGDGADNLTPILKVFEDSKQQNLAQNSRGYVYVERIDAKNKEERNAIVKEKLLSFIDELCNKRKFSHKDIAVLCRDNDEVEAVTSWLLAAEVPVESEKTLNILENHLLKEIISLLRFLHSPIDDLSFAAFILGEIFAKTTGVSREIITDFIFQLHKKRNHEEQFSLYHSFRVSYSSVWEKYLEEFFKSVGFVSAYELTVAIYERFKLMENFSDSQAFFMKFLELIKANEDEYADLGEFLNYLESAPLDDLYVNIGETNYVHVLTIHKAKGLEFGVVIIPFLYMDIKPETGGREASFCVPDQEDEMLRLMRITQNHLKYSKHLNKIYQDAYLKACIDELNNIYVALTRAKFELYIFIPLKSGSSANKANCLISENITELGEKAKYEIKELEARPLLDIAPSVYANWLKAIKDEFGEPQNLLNRQKIVWGNIMHCMLSYIDNLNAEDKDICFNKAIRQALVVYPFVKDPAPLVAQLAALLEKEEAKPFFYVSGAKIYREKEVVNDYGDTRRIDRLIVKEDELWVIDFKSSRQFDALHKEQINEYAEIMRSIYPKHKVKGFLVYLDEAAVEEVI